MSTPLAPDETRPTTRFVEQVMGLPITLALRGRDSEDPEAIRAWASVLVSLRRHDAMFSTYRDDSFISAMNRGEVTMADAPADVVEVLRLGEQARVESHGAFDVRRDGVLDPSGVVKGWAVQRAALALDSLADTDYCLSAGGDMTMRTSAGGEPWRIGIEDPLDPSRILAVVPVRSGAVATSALTHRGAHISDPRTGETPGELASVTVIATDLTWADMDATAAFVLGSSAQPWLEDRGRTGILVDRLGAATTFGPRAGMRS